MPPRVASLHIYPVKSCKGITLQSAVLAQTGLAHDRNWVVIDEASGRFLSQRTNGKLALIEVALPPESLTADWGTLPPDAALCLSAPGMAPLQVPLQRAKPSSDGATGLRKVVVWGWKGVGDDEGDTAADWLSEVLGQRCRLLRYAGGSASSFDDPSKRPVDQNWVDPAAGYEVGFADGFPLLLASVESLEDLNRRMAEPLPMNRFRPNIVLEGLSEPFEEDRWAALQISTRGGAVSFSSPKPCVRCKITTIDQDSGVVGGKEPLATLNGFRNEDLGWRKINRELAGPTFGWNLVASSTGHTICVGDEVSVTQWRDRATLEAV